MSTIPKITLPPRRSLIYELFVDNPMFDEALRARRRFRRGGANAGPALYYAVIGLIVLIYAWSIIAIVHGVLNVTEEVTYFELIVVTLAMPVSVFSTIAGERERATWEALVLTRLSPGQILAGKLTWRILTLLTLMLIFSVQIFIGEMLHPEYGLAGTLFGQTMVLAWGAFLGAFTLLISSMSKRGVAALGITAASLLVSLVLLPLLVSMFGGYDYYNPGQNDWFSWQGIINFTMKLNPFAALGSIIHGVPPPPRPDASMAEYGYNDSQNTFYFVNNYMPSSTLVYLALFVVCLVLAHRVLRRLEAPQETERDFRKRFRDEIGPHIAIGVTTAVVLCVLSFYVGKGDALLTVTTTIFGLVMGTFCAWLVSRGNAQLARRMTKDQSSPPEP